MGYEPSEENDARWKSWLCEHGYESRYVQRTKKSNAKKDGSCVAWRASTFALEDSRNLEYNDIGYELYGRDDANDETGENEARRRYLRGLRGEFDAASANQRRRASRLRVDALVLGSGMCRRQARAGENVDR